jgi:hypothetical protein
MSLSNYAEDAFLNHIRGGATFTAPSGVYAKLHLGDPGEAGTSNAATEATRKAITFAAASGGSMVSTGSPAASWTNVSTTETYTHVSFWDASSAGNCLGSSALSASAAMTAGDTFQLSTVTWTLD